MNKINTRIRDLVYVTQEKWAKNIIDIGKAHAENRDLKDLMFNLLNNIYAFEISEVLFKPTLAKNQQFRSTKEEFISYFLGNNKVCDEDRGFAVKKWKSIKFDNYKILAQRDFIISMGNYFFENQEKSVLKVEYTFGFIRVNPDELRINLHHSSLPCK